MKKETANKFIEQLRDSSKKEEWLRLLTINFPKTRHVLEIISEDISKFDCNQLNQIMYGLQNRLECKHIFLYAKPEFDCYQMREIRLGFESDLGMCQVMVYAKPEFNYKQMREIRVGFERGLSIIQVEEYAKPSLESCEMMKLRIEKQFYIANKNSKVKLQDILLEKLTR